MIKDKELLDNFTKRIALYEPNFLRFCREVLGFKDLNGEHEKLCKLMTSKRHRLILMPRFSFKSSICTIAYSLWKLARNSDLRILIYSDAATKAEGFLTSIRNHIEGKVKGSTFREKFGQWETNPDKGGTWNNSQIIISERQGGSAEPSIDTGGIETSKIGFHYDIIIFELI